MRLPRDLERAIWLYQQAAWDYNQTYHTLQNHNSRKRVKRQLEDARDMLIQACLDAAAQERENAA